MTFSQYLSDARIRHAVRLLKGTELSVSEISAKCGFTNPNYMGDVFRSAVGVSPDRIQEALTIRRRHQVPQAG